MPDLLRGLQRQRMRASTHHQDALAGRPGWTSGRLDGERPGSIRESMLAMSRTSFVAFVLGWWLTWGLGCTQAPPPSLPPDSPFPLEPALSHGVASGDVTSHSAHIWLRTTGPSTGWVVWGRERDWPAQGLPGQAATALEGKGLSRTIPTATSHETDFTGVVRLEGLHPATPYRYRVITNSVSGPQDSSTAPQEYSEGRFTTAGLPDEPVPVTFVWSGDLGGQQHCRKGPEGYQIFDQILRSPPDFAILLGDFIYADERCPSPPNLPGSDFVASTVEEYRAKYRYQRADPALQRFLARIPVYVTWDDHEVRNNFSGPFEPLMAVGRQALFEYWPLAKEPSDPTRLYRKISRGAHLDLFLLDTRQYRSLNADPDGEEKTMLGKAQREWLIQGLQESRATWKVVATSVPLSNTKGGTQLRPGNDSWARGAEGTGFQTELQKIVKVILTRNVHNVVWVAADVHYAQVNMYDPDADGVPDFYEFIAGPFSAGFGRGVAPDTLLRPTTLYSDGGFANFGRVTIGESGLHVEIVDDTGVVRFATTLPRR